MEDIPSYQGILKMFFEVENINNKFGKKYNFYKTERRKILKGSLSKYRLDEEYEVAILKSIGKMILEYSNPVINKEVVKVIYCLNGECVFSAYPSNKTYSFKKGDILIYGMKSDIEKYVLESNNLETLTINLYLDKMKNNLSKIINKEVLFSWNDRILKILNENTVYYGKTNSEIDILAKYIQKSKLENVENYFLFKINVFKLLFLILHLQVKEIEKKKDNIDDIEIVKNVKQFLSRYEISNIPTVKELCDIMNLTNHKIQTSFKEIEGISVAQYIQKMKLDYSKYLLETTDKNIIEISYEIGYDNPSKFSKAFKKYFGVLPSKYRKN